jgi:hypothetical protein
MWEEIENQGVIAGFRSPDFITLPRRSGRTGRFQFELSRGNSRIVANQKLGAPAWNSTWASGNSGFVATVRTIELKLVDKRIVPLTRGAPRSGTNPMIRGRPVPRDRVRQVGAGRNEVTALLQLDSIWHPYILGLVNINQYCLKGGFPWQ